MTPVLIIGATGFIGSALHAALLEAGHSVVATYHRGKIPRLPALRTSWRPADLARMQEADWCSHLIGINVVVNCAGVLQDSAWDSTAAVHVEGLKRLVSACERVGTRRFIQIADNSAIIALHRRPPSAPNRT